MFDHQSPGTDFSVSNKYRKASNSKHLCAYLPNVVVEGVLVVLPVLRKLCCWRELITAQLQGDLKTVGGQVVEVLHTCNIHGEMWCLF